MLFTDQLIRMTEEAHQTFLTYVRATPADKLQWSVLDKGRTPLSLLQEVAQAPTWAYEMISTRSCPEFDTERMEAEAAKMKEWDTVEKCEAVLRENLAKFYDLVRAFPQEDLGIVIHLTFLDNLPQSMADLMGYPYWNTTYHLGQLAFIQTLYGDTKMHT